MISRYLSRMVGVSCRDFVSPAGVPMAEIGNPFRFLDGDAVVVYCKQISSTEVEFFDDCATLTQVMATNGVNISRGDMNTILAICARYNVQHKFGRLSLGSSIDKADLAFSAFLRALLEIDAKVCGKGLESQPAISTKKKAD